MTPIYANTDNLDPRDFFYKVNKEMFSNLIAISASGNTNGIIEALANFNGNKYLICEKEKNINCQVISWSNKLCDREKSFISLATSIGPITLLLDSTTSLNMEMGSNEIIKINSKIKELLIRSKNKINKLPMNFKDTSLIQIMSGYETKISSNVLESNLVEVGLCAPVIHDKGSYCHGRSNLLFQFPNSYMFYLSHNLKELDKILINSISSQYANISVFNTEEIEENIFWKEYYLMIQMYFLSKKIADDKKSGFNST